MHSKAFNVEDLLMQSKAFVSTTAVNKGTAITELLPHSRLVIVFGLQFRVLKRLRGKLGLF
jgi:hypothetical protein